ncbi:ATP-binding protein [Caballeronia sp. LZ034LL]|uniref:ATP-binding protein n=1 Tax=Caballeronia sp. LZ034LL TaxID=3038567 RepID=UPI0028669A85|nr:ATP-binding protein [Caballeronia sp. LZ034LL]MDR5837096.1 MASE1 domain-containing protein [Caballeronia sp. LZ034LL]
MTHDVRAASATPLGSSGSGVRHFTAGWRRALALGALYGVLSTPLDTLGTGSSLSAVVWPAPAVAVAYLWRRPLTEWPAALVTIFVAMLIVGRFDEFPLWVDASFALANALGVGMGVGLAWRFVSRRARLDTTARFTRFLLFLPLGTVFAMALTGSLLAHATSGANLLEVWRTIMGSNGLAMLVLVPGLLAWTAPAAPDAPAVRAWVVVVPAVCGAVLMIEAFRIRLPDETEHVLLIVLLVWAAVAGSIRAATLAAFVLAATGIVLTVTGNGSYHQSGIAGVRQLQIDLAVLCTLVFYVAVALLERRGYEARLLRAQKLESLGLLVSGIAHDFNNVLGAVRGHAEYADELLPADAPAHRPLQHVLGAVKSGHAMIEQMLLAVGRGQPRQSGSVAMRAVIDEAVALAASDHHDRVTIDVQYDAALGTEGIDEWRVAGDHAQLVRVLLNLLRNAAQAARSWVVLRVAAGIPRDELVDVGRVPEHDALLLEVHDDGPGIPPDVLPRIFDPFFSTKHKQSGHGLGLSIAAGIVADHEGGIVAGNGPLGGAVFRVLLPARQQHGAQADLPDAVEAHEAVNASDNELEHAASFAPFGQGEAVLLVEDDRALREMLEEWLAEAGFEPSSHAAPAAALAALQADPHGFAFLVSDIEMDDLRGDELIVAARARRPELPALLISGARQGAHIAAGVHVPFLAKPFGRAAFARAVQALYPSHASSHASMR